MGIKERKQRDFDNRRERILETAKQLFARKGFPQVTLDDIAQEIEFSKGTIYSHFHSKEEIYAQLLHDMLASLLALLKEAVQKAQSTIDGIKRCVEAYLKFYTDQHEYYRLLFFIDIFSDQHRISQQLLKAIQFLKLQCLLVLQQLIRRGIDSGELRSDISERKAAMVLWGMANGVFQLAETGQVSQADLDPLLTVGHDLVSNGLLILK